MANKKQEIKLMTCNSKAVAELMKMFGMPDSVVAFQISASVHDPVVRVFVEYHPNDKQPSEAMKTQFGKYVLMEVKEEEKEPPSKKEPLIEYPH